MSALNFADELLKIASQQLAKNPTETDVMTLAFSLVPRVEHLAKGTLKGSEKMELLLSALDGALALLDPATGGPLRSTLRDRIVPSVSGLINASKTGDVSLGIASAVTAALAVKEVTSSGCFCFKRPSASAPSASAPSASAPSASAPSASAPSVSIPELPPTPPSEQENEKQ